MKFTRFDVYLCLTALIASVAIGVAYLDSGQREILKQVQELRTRPAAAPQNVAAPQKPQLPPLPAKLSIANAATRGNADAKVVMVEFSDFECPFCGRYTRETLPQIDKAYVDTGKIGYVWRNNPLPPQMHPKALESGEAGECARMQGKFWPMHDALYGNQDKFESDFNGLMTKLSAQVGLDTSAFTKCLASGVTVSKIRADQQEAAQAGAAGTPYFFFGVRDGSGQIKVLDRIVEGAVPFDRFKAVLDKLIASAG